MEKKIMVGTRKSCVPLQEQVKFIDEYCKRGMTDADWCRENDITPSTFYNWSADAVRCG